MEKKKEFDLLIDKIFKKKEKMSGRDFIKLVFLSGWDVGRKEVLEEIKKLPRYKQTNGKSGFMFTYQDYLKLRKRGVSKR